MDKEKVAKIKKIVKKKFKEKEESLHEINHLERVKKNAFKIVDILKIELDKNLLEAIVYLHDITYAYHESGLRTYFFEGQLVKEPALEILKKVKVKKKERDIIINAITKHAHSFPFKQLNKNEDEYTKLLQDAETIDLFSEERVKPFLEEQGLKSLLTVQYLNFGKTFLDKYLNFPELADYFREEDYYYQEIRDRVGKGLAHKNESWLLKKYEDKFISFALPYVPKFIETYHLTYFTILWSILALFSGYMARNNILWFWGVSITIFLQHITDMLDGTVGRERGTGLIIWGFFMDHFLDYIFAYSVISAYILISPRDLFPYLFALSVVTGAILNLSTVSAALTRRVSISFYGFGTSELRWVIIIFNILLIHLNPGLIYALPFVLGLLIIVLILKLRAVHKDLWKLDMDNKKKN